MTDKRDLGLPVKEFMYTLDQIAFLLQIGEVALKRNHLHFHARSLGACPRDKMLAVDVSNDETKIPEWRVSETHLKRWMRFKGWKIYERGYLK